ncbi:sensor histidine kinase [Pseudonocardia sp. TRM90224]|uniref:sensor histidine kinase n=1 Tax=Pseudonocardia sp. TRM90224 TaxID=2812678 RepID=UPI001E500DC6|nr:histidine kinase [Pseudonocardia sp. TRM90224]
MTVLDARVDGPVWLLVCLVVGQSLALVWCRRFPLTVLVVVAVLEAALVMVDMELLVGFLGAACGLGAWANRRQQQAGLAFGFGLMALVLFMTLAGGNQPGYAVPGTAALTAMFVGFWMLGRLSARHLGRIGELMRYSRRLEQERASAERRAAERERVLLARELHDILNHAVTVMVLDADVTSETGDEAELRAALRRLAETGRTSLAELRRLLGVLRAVPDSADYDPLAILPGLDDVESLLTFLRDSGPRVRLERYGTPERIDASVSRAAYRVVQESLTNVGKHAGAVDVTVALVHTPEALTVRVSNTPPIRTCASGGGGMGLIGMRERVELVGGTLATGHRADGGFEVNASFPMRGRT